MRKYFLFLLFFNIFLITNAQQINDYEQKISDTIDHYDSVITFNPTGSKISLFASIVTPKNDFSKLVIIIPGSGPDTHRSHFELVEELVKRNIGVIRYDDRGAGDSEGAYRETLRNLSSDLKGLLKYGQDNNLFQGKKVGLIGHSLGGMVSISSNSPEVDFYVQWATPVNKYALFSDHQLKNRTNQDRFNLNAQLEVNKAIRDILAENPGLNENKIHKLVKKEVKRRGIEGYKWLYGMSMDIMMADLEPIYAGVSVPMLYIIGGNDAFVGPGEETIKLKSFDNPNIKVKVFDEFDHYLTKRNVASIEDNIYDIDNEASEYIVNWINQL